MIIIITIMIIIIIIMILTTIFPKYYWKIRKNDICFRYFGGVIASQGVIRHPRVRKGVIKLRQIISKHKHLFQLQSHKLLPKKILKRALFLLATLGLFVPLKLLCGPKGCGKLLCKHCLCKNINKQMFQLQSIKILPKRYWERHILYLQFWAWLVGQGVICRIRVLKDLAKL